jgi:6-pyruvoyltetrahydropterin/6-carboxytetrahydropterin synthase
MPTRISKEFRWEMGHRLPYHYEMCRNLHGHSYRMVVEVEGEHDAGGMVMDYGEIGRMVRPIIDQIDHCFMVDDQDMVMKTVVAENDFKFVEVDFYTTAENIAHWILGQILGQIVNDRILEVVVRIFETTTSMAEAKWTRG